MQPSSPLPADSSGPSLEDVRALARLLRESGLSEVSIDATDKASQSSLLTLRRASGAQAAAIAPTTTPKAPVVAAATSANSDAATTLKAPAAAPASESTAEVAAPSKAAGGEILATAVGLFRDAKPPLNVGDEVKHGQVVGFVESLKVPSEIHAPGAGRVSELLCEAGQGVEYGQVLMRLEPVSETEAHQGESL